MGLLKSALKFIKANWRDIARVVLLLVFQMLGPAEA